MGQQVKLTLLSVFSLQLCLKKLLTSLSTKAVSCRGHHYPSHKRCRALKLYGSWKGSWDLHDMVGFKSRYYMTNSIFVLFCFFNISYLIRLYFKAAVILKNQKYSRTQIFYGLGAGLLTQPLKFQAHLIHPISPFSQWYFCKRYLVQWH